MKIIIWRTTVKSNSLPGFDYFPSMFVFLAFIITFRCIESINLRNHLNRGCRLVNLVC